MLLNRGNRSNGHVLKKDVQTPPAAAPDAAPDDTDGAGGDEASSTDTLPPRPASTEGNGADAGKQWYSDEELAHWIADSVGA